MHLRLSHLNCALGFLSSWSIKLTMKFDLTIEQYEVVYRVVSSLGAKFSHGVGSSCQFYNVNAAFIINNLFNIKARPVMGAYFILLNDERFILSYAEMQDGKFYSSPKGFHCWVETDDFFIDFTAPEYSESAACRQHSKVIPKKMFQKNKMSISANPHSLNDVGDFYLRENVELTEHLIDKINLNSGNRDMAEISLHWAKEILENNIMSLSLTDDLGKVSNINLINSNLVSAW